MTTIARPKEGPRAPLFYWAPVILILAAGVAQAQTVDLADLEACAALDSDESKLACFEAIVAVNRPSPTPAPQPPTEAAPAAEPVAVQSASAGITPASEPVQATAAPAIAEAVPGPSSASAAPAAVVAATARTEPAPEPTREVDAPAELPPAQAPAPTPAANASAQSASASAAVAAEPSATAADDFGREHLERGEDPDQETLEATVIDVTKTGYGELVFHLDNGQVWRQQEKRYYPYPRNREFDATISRGILGEYQLQVEGTGRKVTIRRIR